MIEPRAQTPGFPSDGEVADDRLVRDLIDGRTDNVRQLFSAERAKAPMVVWSPTDCDLRHPLLARFAHLCREMLHTDGRVLLEDFDLERFWSIHRWIMTVDVDASRGKFMIGHFGRGIAESYGTDMTGRPVSDMAPHIYRFYAALFEAAARRREWVLTEHEAPRQVFVQSWRRLSVPLFDRAGRVRRFVILAYPENELRAGLEIIPDPIFIVDQDQLVRFANRAARNLFGYFRRTGEVPSLRELCGFDLEIGKTAFELYETGSVENSVVHLNFGDRLVDDFLVTISAATQRDRAFYVVMIRLTAPA